MTSGTKVLNHRYTYYTRVSSMCNFARTPIYGNLTVGNYSTKTWDGPNSPKRAAKPRQLLNFSYPVYSKSGRFLYTRFKFVWYPRRYEWYPIVYRSNPYTSTLRRDSDIVENSAVLCTPSGDRTTWFWNYSLASTTGRGQQFANYVQVGSEELLALRGKLRSRVHASFNLAVTLGEARESLRTITQSATRLYKAWKALKKGNVVSSLNELLGARGKRRSFVDKRNFADNWLQIRYGWLPLLKDISSACEHLAYLRERPFEAKYRVRAYKEFHGRQPSGYSGVCTDRIQVIANIKSINEFKLAGLADPASLAWELLPLSFVADWFIPIGNYLEGQAVGGAITADYVITRSQVAKTLGYQPSDPAVRWNSSFNHDRRTVARTISSSLPELKTPSPGDLTKVVDWKRAITAVSLVIQRMR